MILNQEKPIEYKITLDGNWVRKMFPKNMTPQQIKDRINQTLDLLEKNFSAYIIKADDVAKQLMEPGGKAFIEVVDFFGEEILLPDGTIDRKKLAAVVFANPNKRIVLNSITHPLVKKKIMEQIACLKAEDTYEYCFVEAALLIEDHYQTVCDEFWYIYVPETLRRERLKASRGYTDEKIDSILKSQLTEEEFAKACAHTVDNSKDLDFTLSQLEKLLQM